MNLALRLNTGSVYWMQLANNLYTTGFRPLFSTFLNSWDAVKRSYSSKEFGAVSGVINPLDLSFVYRFASTVPFFKSQKIHNPMQKALPKSELKALFENSIQSIELATNLTKEHRLHLYKSLLNSITSLITHYTEVK